VRGRLDQYTRHYGDTLDRLWRIRRKTLLSLLTHKGRPPYKLNARRRREIIDEAWWWAYDAMRPLARKEFMALVLKSTTRRKVPRMGARGVLNWPRVRRFLGRLPRLESDNQVYVFWDHRKCVYVGQSSRAHKGGGGKWRPAYWRESNRYRVFSTREYRNLAKFECLAMDYFRPTENDVKAPNRKYHAKCPVHKRLNAIERELKRSFKLR
jgi:hypothetical protein